MHYYDYLEIGIRNPSNNFDHIEVGNKIGVDPAVNHQTYKNGFIYSETSNYFFKHNCRNKFDLIFIDGLHIASQVIEDLYNSLTALNERGTILLHDVNPRREEMAGTDPIKGFGWCGTVWKAWAWFRMTRPDLTMYKIKGLDLGVVRPGEQKVFEPTIGMEEMDWDFFVKNKAELLPERDM